MADAKAPASSVPRRPRSNRDSVIVPLMFAVAVACWITSTTPGPNKRLSRDGVSVRRGGPRRSRDGR